MMRFAGFDSFDRATASAIGNSLDSDSTDDLENFSSLLVAMFGCTGELVNKLSSCDWTEGSVAAIVSSSSTLEIPASELVPDIQVSRAIEELAGDIGCVLPPNWREYTIYEFGNWNLTVFLRLFASYPIFSPFLTSNRYLGDALWNVAIIFATAFLVGRIAYFQQVGSWEIAGGLVTVVILFLRHRSSSDPDIFRHETGARSMDELVRIIEIRQQQSRIRSLIETTKGTSP